MASPGAAVVAGTHTLTASTPGKISTSTHLNHKANTFHFFPAGHVAYRGDNSFNANQADNYQAQFFTPAKEVAESQYGKLVLKFTLKKEVKLLRLDKNAEGFHDWLKTTKNVEDQHKTILYKNFGYPEHNSPTVSAGEPLRSRFSQGAQDRKMLEIIKCYSDETGQKIDGYYNSAMSNGTLGSMKTQNGDMPLFHAELAVFSSKEVFNRPETVSSLDPDQIKILNQEDKLTRYTKEQKTERPNKRRHTFSDSSTADPTIHQSKRRRFFSL